jgi:hypothetical protein
MDPPEDPPGFFADGLLAEELFWFHQSIADSTGEGMWGLTRVSITVRKAVHARI